MNTIMYSTIACPEHPFFVCFTRFIMLIVYAVLNEKAMPDLINMINMLAILLFSIDGAHPFFVHYTRFPAVCLRIHSPLRVQSGSFPVSCFA